MAALIPTNKKENVRSDWVDYAKCIGILLVVYGHVARGIYNAGIPMDQGLFRLVDSIIYSFHMPLFFFLSGLFFYSSLMKRGRLGLFFNKIDVIFYPYILWSVIQFFIEFALSGYTNGHKNFKEIIRILWQPIDHFWFLYALFFITIFASLIYWNIKKSLFLVIVIIGVLVCISTNQLNINIPILIFIANFFVFFAVGTWFKEAGIEAIFLNSSRILFLPMLLLFISAQWVYHIYWGLSYIHKSPELLILSCISVAFVIVASIELTKLKSDFLLKIGYSSMGIYLMHVLVGSGVRIALQKLLQINNVSIHLILGCLCAVMTPLIALNLMQRFNIKWLLEMPHAFSFSHFVKRRLLR